MGIKNFLIEGVSCSGKTSVCDELERRGFQPVHGDRALAYWGDPKTGKPVNSTAYQHWIWDVDKVRALVSDQSYPATFFCGGSRNLDNFIYLFDAAFVLEIDAKTLDQRLEKRPDDEWGGPASDGAANARLQHKNRDYIPENAIFIDATAPLAKVVDVILDHAGLKSG